MATAPVTEEVGAEGSDQRRREIAAPVPPTRSRGWLRRRATRNERALITMSSVAVMLVVWEILPATDIVNVDYTSQPHRILGAGIDLFEEGGFYEHLWVSLEEFGFGFGLAALVGTGLGLAVGYSRLLRDLFEPLLLALYMTPRLALMPLIIVALGIGTSSKVAVVFIGAFLPVVINAVAGIAEADPKLLQAARSYGARRREVMFKVLLPGAIPSLIAGLRYGAARAVLGVVIAEMYVSTAGIGYLIRLYGTSLRTDRLIFLASLVGVFGYAVTYSLQSLERSLSSWKGQ